MKGVFGTKPKERERTREHEKSKNLRVLLSSSDCGTGFIKPDQKKRQSFTDIRATKAYKN